MTLPPPFSGSPPTEVSLSRAPLVRVLSQIRFPQILNILKPETVAPFQELIRRDYPLMQSQLLHTILIPGPDGNPAISNVQVWRFEDKSHHWRASLATDFLALETTKYTSRTDFLSRLSRLIDALQTTFNPQITQRIGLRYIDRLQDKAFSSITDLIKPDFLGPSESDYQAAAIHMLTQALFTTEEGAHLNARWGKLPPGVTLDPNAIEPINEPSWVMDFDMFMEAERGLTAAELTPLLESFAKRLYAVFRFMVTDQFLEFYGGKP
jgi:uncharacterized protein (TIGR04255 family)